VFQRNKREEEVAEIEIILGLALSNGKKSLQAYEILQRSCRYYL